MDTRKKQEAGSNKPGQSQLGHKPMSKVKLEGPKVHHDDHGPKASRPMKGNGPAVPNQHWERLYDATGPSENMKLVEGGDFNPKCSDMRKTTYIKVNREDH